MPARPCSPSRSVGRRQTLTLGYSAPWDRQCEAQRVPTCTVCGGDMAPDPAGEFVCLGCLHTGRDEELEYDRRLALGKARAAAARFKPKVPAEPAPEPPVEVPPLVVRFKPETPGDPDGADDAEALALSLRDRRARAGRDRATA